MMATEGILSSYYVVHICRTIPSRYQCCFFNTL